LFVICIERLAHKINEQVQLGRWHPIRFGREKIPIPYLLLADDIILFLEADEGQIQVVKEVLDEFCYFSGMMVSKPKSQVFFSGNLEMERQLSLAEALGYNTQMILGLIWACH